MIGKFSRSKRPAKSATTYISGRVKPLPPTRSHSLEQANSSSNSNKSDHCNPYASSPVVVPQQPASSDTAAAGSVVVPPSGYVLAGQMNLGAINVTALNSANLSKLACQLVSSWTSCGQQIQPWKDM